MHPKKDDGSSADNLVYIIDFVTSGVYMLLSRWAEEAKSDFGPESDF